MLSKQLKNGFEFIGVLATIWGLVVSIQNEKIIYTITLAIVIFVILFFRYKHLFIKPIYFHEIEFEFTIHDAEGKLASCKKSKTFTINDDNITTIRDRNIGGSGNVIFKKSNLGHVIPILEGGGYSLITMFNPPLEKGVKHNLCLETDYINCFTDNKESILVDMDRRCEKIKVSVLFPNDRICKSAKAYLLFDDSGRELEKPTIKDNGKKIEFEVIKPKQFGKYNIEFEW